MKKLTAVILIAVMLLGLCSCGDAQQKHYESSDYILEVPYTDDFRVLQLTDIHLANKDNRKIQYDFLTDTIEAAGADMIVITGDMFTYADKTVAKEFFSFMDSFGIPWSVTFGNHDEQCYFSVDWLTGYLNEFGSNCVFKDIPDDDVYGNANYAVNLTRNGKTVEQIIIMDSNRYNFGEYTGYDYLKDDQIRWYESIVSYTTEENGGVIPSLLFMHIPLPELKIAKEMIEEGDGVKSSDGKAVLEYGSFNENVCSPLKNTGMFDMIKKLGSTDGVFTGHDHINNARVLYDGVYLCYGINSTDRIYYQDGMMGGQVIVIHDDGSLDFEYIYHDYSGVQK